MVFTWVSDGQGADVEVFTASGSQVDVVARVVMDTSLGEHSIVLGLGFSARKGNKIGENPRKSGH